MSSVYKKSSSDDLFGTASFGGGGGGGGNDDGPAFGQTAFCGGAGALAGSLAGAGILAVTKNPHAAATVAGAVGASVTGACMNL